MLLLVESVQSEAASQDPYKNNLNLLSDTKTVSNSVDIPRHNVAVSEHIVESQLDYTSDPANQSPQKVGFHFHSVDKSSLHELANKGTINIPHELQKLQINMNANNFEPSKNTPTTTMTCRLWFSNVDCLMNKLSELHLRINSEIPPDIIMLAEINPKRSKFDRISSELNLHGYQFETAGFDIPNHRGLLVYYKQHMGISMVDLKSMFREHLCFKFMVKGRTYYFLVVYRSPHSDHENDILLLNLLEEFISTLPGDHFIVGDFNLPSIDWNLHSDASGSSTTRQFLDFLDDRFMTQHITEPTRFRKDQQPSTLDLLISDSEMILDFAVLPPLARSDHAIIEFDLQTATFPRENQTHRYCYDRGDYINMNNQVRRELDSIPTGLCIEGRWDFFKDVILRSVDRFVPKKGSSHTYNFKITSEAKRLINNKKELWKKVRLLGMDHYEDYKIARDKLRKMTRRLRSEEINRICESFQENPKRFWSSIRSKTNATTRIGALSVGDNVVTDDAEKAHCFAEYFGSVFLGPEENMGTPEIQPIQVEGMRKININQSTVLKKLSSIKKGKSPGPDGIHPRVLWELRFSVVEELTELFRLSVQCGHLPVDWKRSLVVPIFKKGRKSFVKNYRPVALTSVVCKILESIIKDDILTYFIGNDLLSNCQFGFLPGRSTTLQLLRFLDIVSKKIDDGYNIDVIYTDIAKAFDRLDFNYTLSKLLSYGVHAETVNWMMNYLCGRSFQVRVNSSWSAERPVLSGVPQGSVLGPLIFVLYMNDPPTQIQSSLLLYADDAKLFGVSDVQSELQDNLDELCNWFQKWRLKLNPDKCNCLRLGTRRSHRPVYSMPVEGSTSHELETVTSARDLGIVVDSRLNFGIHIQSVVKKANSILGVIGRHFRGLSRNAFLTLYKSLVLPILEYGDVVWNPHHKGLILALEKVQRRATKMLPAMKNLPYSVRLRLLNLPSLSYRRKRDDLVLVFKIVHCLVREDMAPTLLPARSNRTRGHPFKLTTDAFHSDVRKFFFSNRVVEEWNHLPVSVVDSDTLQGFKVKLDTHYGDGRFDFVS